MKHNASPSYIGHTFGRLTITDQMIVAGRTMVVCLCSCGNTTTDRLSRVKNKERGCGCLRGSKSVRHSHAKKTTPTYSSWRSMKSRCLNEHDPSFSNYGARSITVYPAWLSFAAFLADMGERPSLQHSLDRIDNARGYEPTNCRWADLKTQNRNKRDNAILEHCGQRLCIADWADVTGLPHNTIRGRIKRGWSAKDSLTTPYLGRGGRRGQG